MPVKAKQAKSWRYKLEAFAARFIWKIRKIRKMWHGK